MSTNHDDTVSLLDASLPHSTRRRGNSPTQLSPGDIIDRRVALAYLGDGDSVVFLVEGRVISRSTTLGTCPEEVLCKIEADTRKPSRQLGDGDRLIDDISIRTFMDPILRLPKLSIKVTAFSTGPLIQFVKGLS